MFTFFLYANWDLNVVRDAKTNFVIERTTKMMRTWQRNSVDDLNLLISAIKLKVQDQPLDEEIIKKIEQTIKKEAKLCADYKERLQPTWLNYLKDKFCDAIAWGKNLITGSEKPKLSHAEKRQMLEYKFRMMPTVLSLASKIDMHKLLSEGLKEYQYEAYPVFEESELVDGKMTAIKAALLVTWHVLSERSFNNEQFLPSENSNWIDSTTLMHVVDAIEPLEGSIFSYKDEQTNSGILLVHNGYIFGGQRFETRYGEYGRETGPYDCTSILEKVLQLKHSLTTLILYKWIDGRLEQDLPAKYVAIKPFLDEHFRKVEVKSFDDIKPGMIYMHSKPGHIAPILSKYVDQDGKTYLYCPCYHRELDENSDGFGVLKIAYPFEREKAVVFEIVGF